ncbi:MAG: ABC transporter permease [Lachnospiraceae bacterium]|nr:ABC transporter permease [Lachnospiraceae bacterium]
MNFSSKITLAFYGIIAYLLGITVYQVLRDPGAWSFVLLGVAVLICFWLVGSKLISKKKQTILSRIQATFHRFSFLIEQLVARDFKTKYKRSVLGVFWSFLNPLLMMAVQYFVFIRLMNLRNSIGSENPMLNYYAVYLLVGIIIFGGFNDCCNQALRSIVYNASLITKVYVPKIIYPTTKVFSAGINLALSILPLYIIALINGLVPNFSILVLPLGLLFILVFTIGMGYFLSATVVFFRDIEFLWGVFSTMWMYATPIIYDIGFLPNTIQKLMFFNPLYHYIDFVRYIVILRQVPTAEETLICAAFSLGMFVLGLTVFKKTEDKFIFYI